MRRRHLLELEREFERAFRDARAWADSPGAAPGFDPPTDVSRTNDAYFIRLDLPGVTRESLRVYAQDGAVRISANKDRPDDGGARLLRTECEFGRLGAVVPLPSDADLGRVVAELSQGVLEVRVARRQKPHPGRIEIAVD